MEFLHDGAPEMRARRRAGSRPRSPSPRAAPDDLGADACGDLLARLNLTSGERKARHYDHEVKGLTVIKPFVGVDADVPAEATVFLARHGSLARASCSPRASTRSSPTSTPRRWPRRVVDEAVRRQLCAGARLDRIAALDNFCWPDPVQSETHTRTASTSWPSWCAPAAACTDACRAYGVPLISGKDSMKNESTMGGVKICVPPTLLVSAIGQIDDVRQALTLDFKQAGDVLFLLGETGDQTGGSEYYRYLGRAATAWRRSRASRRRTSATGRPAVDPEQHPAALPGPRRARSAAGWCARRRPRRRGGLAVCLARCAMAGRPGRSRSTWTPAPAPPSLTADLALFGESNGRFLVTVAAEDDGGVRGALRRAACAARRHASPPSRGCVVHRGDERLIDAGLDDARAAVQGGARAMPDGSSVDALRGPAGRGAGAATRRRARAGAHRPGSQLRGRDRRRLPAGRRHAQRVPLLDLLDGGGRSADRLSTSSPSSAASPSATTWAPALSSPTRSATGSTISCSSSSTAAAWRIGICNGFQTMVRLGLLPGFDGDYRTPRATLAPNDRLGYWDCWVRLAVDPESPCVWTRGIDTLELPSRHGEGKFLAADDGGAERLEDEPPDRRCATSTPTAGRPRTGRPTRTARPARWPASATRRGRLFGLMPHPDAYLYPFQHPQWHAAAAAGDAAGRGRRAGDLPQRRRRRGGRRPARPEPA